MCGRSIFNRSASSPPRDDVTTDPTLLNMKNDIFPLIYNIVLSKVLTLHYPVHPEMLAVIYWNLYVVLKWYIER